MTKSKKQTGENLFLVILIYATGLVISFITVFVIAKLSVTFISSLMLHSSTSVKQLFIFVVTSGLVLMVISLLWSWLLAKLSFALMIKDSLKKPAKTFCYLVAMLLFSITSGLASGYVLTDVFIDRSGLNPEKATVPDFIGLSLEQASSLLIEYGLDTLPSANIHYFPGNQEYPESTIFKQDPPPGINIAHSGQIEIWINLTKEEIVQDTVLYVPHVDGLTADRAVSLIRSKGLVPEVESLFSDSVSPGRIISTDPRGGEVSAAGDHVIIIVSKGSHPVEVPDLTNMNIIQASELLTSMELNITIADERICSLPPFTILEQQPPPGESLLPGSKVTVVISKEIVQEESLPDF
ncbi:MAG: PASTA domain-containing protein [bacterium]